MMLGEASQDPRIVVGGHAAAEVATALASPRGFFLRTPLLLPLGATLRLAIPMPFGDSVEVHALVVGRAARPKQVGLFVRPTDDDRGLELVRAYAGIAPSRRAIGVDALFVDEDDAHRELHALRDEGEGHFPVEVPLARGQRVRVDVRHRNGSVGLVEGVVHHPVLVDGRRSYVVRTVNVQPEPFGGAHDVV